jgi:hypothetical protein
MKVDIAEVVGIVLASLKAGARTFSVFKMYKIRLGGIYSPLSVEILIM